MHNLHRTDKHVVFTENKNATCLAKLCQLTLPKKPTVADAVWMHDQFFPESVLDAAACLVKKEYWASLVRIF